MGQGNRKMDEPAPSPRDYDHLFKLMIIGNSGVGKTALFYRIDDNAFYPNAVRGEVEFKIRTIIIDGQKVKLQIWDPLGNPKTSLRHWRPGNLYPAVSGFLVVYDITSGESFDEVQNRWLPQTEKYRTRKVRSLLSKKLRYCDPQGQRFLVGNKCDDSEHREVFEADAWRFAEQMNMQFFETSAKDNINVDEMFNTIARHILEAKLRRECLAAQQRVDQLRQQEMDLGARDERQKSEN